MDNKNITYQPINTDNYENDFQNYIVSSNLSENCDFDELIHNYFATCTSNPSNINIDCSKNN